MDAPALQHSIQERAISSGVIGIYGVTSLVFLLPVTAAVIINFSKWVFPFPGFNKLDTKKVFFVMPLSAVSSYKVAERQKAIFYKGVTSAQTIELTVTKATDYPFFWGEWVIAILKPNIPMCM